MKTLERIWWTIRSLWPEDLAEYLYWVGYDEAEGEYKPETCYWFEMTGEMLELLVCQIECQINGHNIVCEGAAGPETGYEDISCTHCGFEEHITYY
jgi:hypothetical protein